MRGQGAERGICSSSHVGKHQELAQDALVQLARQLHQMPVALMADALGAGRCSQLQRPVDVERRHEQQRNIDGQQQPKHKVWRSKISDVGGEKKKTEWQTSDCE